MTTWLIETYEQELLLQILVSLGIYLAKRTRSILAILIFILPSNLVVEKRITTTYDAKTTIFHLLLCCNRSKLHQKNEMTLVILRKKT